MEIKYTTKFRRQYRKADKTIRQAFAQTLEVFLEDPTHPSLRNHTLKEKFVGFRSIDITGDWRAVFKERETEEQKTFIFLGLTQLSGGISRAESEHNEERRYLP